MGQDFVDIQYSSNYSHHNNKDLFSKAFRNFAIPFLAVSLTLSLRFSFSLTLSLSVSRSISLCLSLFSNDFLHDHKDWVSKAFRYYVTPFKSRCRSQVSAPCITSQDLTNTWILYVVYALQCIVYAQEVLYTNVNKTSWTYSRSSNIWPLQGSGFSPLALQVRT